ncbi:CPBP family intramembrane glutamic endopeptidase [Leptolyngbya sp. PCC 6406]|uniref:CPBP family intramembrane glutamic endopeptidase n=1 Tax=Leptolyngbya sp. PCC 6406 TaxID=1173264 RepID=UPI0002ABC2BA|nr:type II CAAX endopeptidase family protein [Leptolyngbya sp. PCC 6406]
MTSETPPQSSNTFRRIVLIAITLLVTVIMGQALVSSWNEPQVANRLELYQTDLLLQATDWVGEDLPPEQVTLIRRNLLGDDPLGSAQDSYSKVRETALALLNEQEEESSAAIPSHRRQTTYEQQAELLDLIDLRLGILQGAQGETAAAVASWQQVQERNARGSDLWRTAVTLETLWQGQAVPTDDDTLLSDGLRGWFRAQALAKFYEETDQPQARADLQAQTQAQATTTVLVLGIVGAFPAVGCLLGVGVLLFVGGQRLLKGKEAWLARNSSTPWEVPWTAETIWQVVVAGFFFLGQVVVPLVVSPLGSGLASLGIRGRATYALLYYVLMAIGAIAVLGVSIRRYRPLPQGWFQFQLKGSWLLWGVGGYLAALPLMLSISLLNQQLWRGQGGSNPLLQTVLEAHDPVALGLFFVTAAIAAPLFEEFLFRGFLLPSLTRYMPVGGAIWLSSFIFAAAHLSLSEILPLMVLGMVLGLVYTRSRNLLAPMVLHSAWNSVTMIGLFLLGSAA